MFFVFKKRKIIISCVLVICVALTCCFLGINSAKQTFFEAEEKTIIIDAGHDA